MSARDIRAAERAEKREAAEREAAKREATEREASIRAESLLYSPTVIPEWKKKFVYYSEPRVWVLKDGEYVEIP